jgi:hypothetical protein
MKYPLRIRFWYLVHDKAERLWHWVYRTKITPWNAGHNTAHIPPTYELVRTIPATPEQQAAGLTEQRIYVSSAASAAAKVQDTRYKWTVTYH